MSLTRSRLELLRRVAENKEADARRAFAEAQRRLDVHQRTEHELRGYLSEYESRPLAAPTPALLENQRQFLLRLRAALDAQHQHAERAAEATEQARLEWLARRNDLRVAETMLEQGCAAERRVVELKAQKEMDEFAITRRPPPAYAS